MRRKVLVLMLIFISFATSLFARPKIALVLSGGGARGLAHIGVIKELEKIGVPIDMVYGTSIGAMVGALYAVGYSPYDMEQLANNTDILNKMDPFQVEKSLITSAPYEDTGRKLLDISISNGKVYSQEGIINDNKILMMLERFYLRVDENLNFNDLEIPFKCIGTDIVNAKEVVFDKGSIVDAVRASISLPIFFPPYEIDGIKYADGGLANNMPIDLAIEDGADIVIAVDVSSSTESIKNRSLDNIFSIAAKYASIIVNLGIEKQREHADIIIVPELGDASAVDFKDSLSFIDKGSAAVIKNIEKLKDILKNVSLVPRSDHRVGPYSLKKTVIIKNINYYLDGKLIEETSKKEWYNLHFSFLKGKPFIGKNIDYLEEYLIAVPENTNFYKATYKLVDNDINIYFSSLGVPEYTFDLDIEGDLDIVFRGENNGKMDFIFRPFIYNKFRILRKVNEIPLIFDINLNYKNGLEISPEFKSIITPWFMLRISTPLIFGDISYESLHRRKILPIDFLFNPRFELSFMYNNQLRVVVGAGVNIFYNHLNYGYMTSDPVIYPYGDLGIKYSNTKTGYFAKPGYKVETIGVIGGGMPSKGYAFTLNYAHTFKINDRNYIGYNMGLSSYRSSTYTQIMKKYFDIGGFKKVSGFPVKTFKQDFAYFNLNWDYKIADIGVPLFLSTAIAIGGANEGDIVESTRPIFTLMDKLIGGLAIGVGAETPIGDVLVGLGISSNFDVTIYLGLQ